MGFGHHDLHLFLVHCTFCEEFSQVSNVLFTGPCGGQNHWLYGASSLINKKSRTYRVLCWHHTLYSHTHLGWTCPTCFSIKMLKNLIVAAVNCRRVSCSKQCMMKKACKCNVLSCCSSALIENQLGVCPDMYSVEFKVEEFKLYQIKSQVTQPLIRVDFIFGDAWCFMMTCSNTLEFGEMDKYTENTLIIFSLQAQNSSREFCHYWNEFWSLWSSDAISNDHSLVFAHTTVVAMLHHGQAWDWNGDPQVNLFTASYSGKPLTPDEFIWRQTPVFKKYTITAYCTVIILFKVIEIVYAPYSKTQHSWSCLNGLHYYTECP